MRSSRSPVSQNNILKELATHKVNFRVHGKLTSLSGQLSAQCMAIYNPSPPTTAHPPTKPFYYP